jgi:glycerol-3-phosphate dehydrogenase
MRRKLVVLGGGILGLGVALEACKKNIDILLLERNSECGREASSSMHRIIHGGFRYLAKADLKRIYESLADLKWMLNEFPDLVRPLPCYMPLNNRGIKSKYPVTVACSTFNLFLKYFGLNDLIASVNHHDVELFDSPNGVLTWFDGLLLEPKSLHNRIISKLLEANVEISCNSTVESINSLQNGDKTIHEILYRTNSGELKNVHADFMVNTTGANASQFMDSKIFNGIWCTAFNVVINRKLPHVAGYSNFSSKGRLFFVTPRTNACALGTQYIDQIPNTGALSWDSPFVQDFLKESDEAFNWQAISKEEILTIEVGSIPVKGLNAYEPNFYGSSLVYHTIPCRVDVISTKYSAFRATAKKVLSFLPV